MSFFKHRLELYRATLQLCIIQTYFIACIKTIIILWFWICQQEYLIWWAFDQEVVSYTHFFNCYMFLFSHNNILFRKSENWMIGSRFLNVTVIVVLWLWKKLQILTKMNHIKEIMLPLSGLSTIIIIEHPRKIRNIKYRCI